MILNNIYIYIYIRLNITYIYTYNYIYIYIYIYLFMTEKKNYYNYLTFFLYRKYCGINFKTLHAEMEDGFASSS